MSIYVVLRVGISNGYNNFNVTIAIVVNAVVALICCVNESVSETFPLPHVRLKAVVLLCHGSELEKLDPAVFQKQLHNLKFRYAFLCFSLLSCQPAFLVLVTNLSQTPHCRR